MFTFFLDQTINHTQHMLDYNEKTEQFRFQKYSTFLEWSYGVSSVIFIPVYIVGLSCLTVIESLLKLILFLWLTIKSNFVYETKLQGEDLRLSEHVYYSFISTLLPLYAFVLLLLTVIYNLCKVFHPNFFSALDSTEKRNDRTRLLDALKEFEQQLIIDIPEINFITERLNIFSKHLDDYIRAFGYINHRSNTVLGQETLKVTSNNSSRVDPKVLVLTQKIDSIYAMLKSYPDVDINLSLNFLEVDARCSQRSEHHEKVKLLADSLFADMDAFEREMEDCLNVQNEFTTCFSCNF